MCFFVYLFQGCPCCNNHVLVPGKNDFKTRFPDIAKEWHPTKNGDLKPSDVMPGSARKMWWLCPYGHEFKKSLNSRTNKNFGCPECNKGKQSSFAEHAFYYYCKQLFPDTISLYREIFDNGMELDIFIPSLKLAIEYDGIAFHKGKIERTKKIRNM